VKDYLQYNIMKHSCDELGAYASALGASGVALGALGAHALRDTLTRTNKLESWRMAATYQLAHAAVIISVSALLRTTDSARASSSLQLARAGRTLALGSALFSGSIYCLCLELGPKTILGPLTPIGGLIMIGGWLLLGFA
jgi:uncharacterized membrane protein YgdD (TMEM256/DUF423 family)